MDLENPWLLCNQPFVKFTAAKGMAKNYRKINHYDAILKNSGQILHLIPRIQYHPVIPVTLLTGSS